MSDRSATAYPPMRRKLLLTASLAGLLSFTSEAAFAQATAPDPNTSEEFEGQPVADEGEEIVVTGQFLDSGASSATKMDISVLDTPFSVASYSDDFLKAIETTNVADLYRYMNGIQRAGNTGYDISIRGFTSGGNDRGVILTDGLPGLSVRFGSPPTVGVDHIEVVKGPTSVLYGQAQPGGFINIITKKPLRSPRYQFTVKGNKGLGTFDRAANFLVSADLTGPIDEDGVVLYRVVGEIGGGDNFRDFSYERPIYVSPSLRFNIADRTSILLSGEYRRVRTHYDNQLVAPNRDVDLVADIDTSYQAPDDYLLEKGAIGTIVLNHEFSEALKLDLAYRYVDHTDVAKGFDSVGFRNPTTLRRRARGQDNKRTYGFAEANLTGEFSTFGIDHQLLVGASYGRETSDFARLQFFNAPATGPLSLDIDVYNPVHNEQPLSSYPLGALNRRFTARKSIGVYASDLLTITEQLKVMVGVRYADEKQRIEERLLPNVPDQSKADTKLLPLAGVIFQPRENISIYASYSTSFVPVPANTQDIFGRNPFSPTSADSIEAGVKAELFDRRLTATAAIFEINKNNEINTFMCPDTLPPGETFPPGVTQLATGTCAAPIGAERARGFELEINASPLPGWQLTAGYAHTEARVIKSNIPEQLGARLTNSPDDSFNIWSRYDFIDGPLKGVGIGVGIAHIGDRVGFLPTPEEPTNLLALPSYTTVDLGLYYQATENLDFTLKFTNLLDERYFESAGFVADIQLVPGVPRLATLTARATF